MRQRRVGRISLPEEGSSSYRRLMFRILLFVAISFALLFISSAYLDIFSNPDLLWGAVLVISVIVSLVLIIRSFPSTRRKETEKKRPDERGKGELEKMSIRIGRGIEGYQYSQMLCYQELKRTLEDRMRVKYRLSEENRREQGDELKAMIDDEDLWSLLITDYQSRFMSGGDRIREGTGESFRRHIERLIDAMEALE